MLKARLDIRNPIDMTISNMFTKTDHAATIWEMISHEKVRNSRALKLLNDEIGLGEMDDVWDALQSEKAIRSC